MFSQGYQFVPQIHRFVPSSGDTVTIPNCPSDMVVIIAPPADIASLTIQWPSTPYNGQVIRILSTKNIASVTSSGATLNRSVPSFMATGDATYIYDSAGSTYMCGGMSATSTASLAFSATVAGGSGNAVFYPTSNGLSGGTPLFASIQVVQPLINVPDPYKAFGLPSVSPDMKTVTTNVKINSASLVQILGINVISGFTLNNAPDGTALSFLVHGLLA